MTARRQRAPRQRQRGVFAILYAILMVPLIAMIGLALDLAIVFSRMHELQNVADSAALAAARALDGTEEGVRQAKLRAAAAATANQYRFLNPRGVKWSNNALALGPTAAGPWTEVDSVTAQSATGMFYARVSADKLPDSIATVSITFLRVVSGGLNEVSTKAVGIAGRGLSNILPLGICALAPTEFSKRTNGVGNDELLEFGFRRGVSYDLLQLSSYDTTPRNYIVNPLAFPPAPARASDYTDAVLNPLACTGAIPAPLLQAGTLVYVKAGFPSTLAPELNTRFDQYPAGDVCSAATAPPDSNIKDFKGGYAGYWMNDSATAVRPSALPATVDGKLLNVALGNGAAASATTYGPLWAASRPLRYDSVTEKGGAPFAASDWAALYPVGSGSTPATSYAEPLTPYQLASGAQFGGPSNIPVQRRRMLNIPLLRCPVVGDTATVAGIGSFFMVSPAGQSGHPGIHGEFVGLTSYGTLAVSTVLYK